MTKAKLYGHGAQRCIDFCKENPVTDEAKDDLKAYLDFCNQLQPSEKTHYNRLDEWRDPVYDFIHQMLKKYGFVSGRADINETNIDAMFWWKVYRLPDDTIYSPLLKTEVARHHASARERSDVLKQELQIILDAMV